jgi:hypothetical protein
MKDLLYGTTFILLLYVLFVDKSILNIFIVSVSIIILITYAYNYKIKKVEKFSITTNKPKFNVENYKEPFVVDLKNSLLNDLVYYISSFNKEFLDFENNLVKNIISNEIGAIFIQNLSNYTTEFYNQYDGIRIENQVQCPNAKQILDSIETFTMFWYVKFITPKSYFVEGGQSFSLIKFDHANIQNSNFTLFEIRLNFVKDMLNPMIQLLFVGGAKNELTYTYTSDQYFNNKIFCDGNYHLITFVKESGKVFLYVDENTFISCDDDNCFDKNIYELHADDTEIEIRNSLMIMNANSMKFYLNAFGIYKNRALDSTEIKSLIQYYKNVKRYLSPDMNEIITKNEKLQKQLLVYTRDCPFSDSTICNSQECFGFTDWNNIQAFTERKECFMKSLKYCNALSNLDNDKACAYINTDNIFSMASAIDSNLLHYNPKNTTNLDDKANRAILAQLDRLGLKNIYLDKSFREANGKYGGEMQRLIDDLLKNNATVNSESLLELPDAINTSITNDIDINNLSSSTNDNSSYETLYNQLLAETNTTTPPPVTTSTPTVDSTDIFANDLIDLNYNDVSQPDSYKHIIKKHKESKLEEEASSWKLPSLLTGWF